MSPNARVCLIAPSLTLAAVLHAGCASPDGDTRYHIQADNRDEEKVLRRQRWRVDRAVEDVRVRYGLMDVNLHVVIMDMDDLGRAMPELNMMAEVKGARVMINKRLLTDDHPEADQVLHGLAAHELAHMLHYAGMSTKDLVELGRRYKAAMKNPESPQVAWVRTYERLTDMTAIAAGYGEVLIWQKWASKANLVANDPPGAWDFYLTEDEIREYMAGPELLHDAITQSLDELGLPSLKRLRERIEFDDEGDIIKR